MPAFPAPPLSDAARETAERALASEYRFHAGESPAAGVVRIALGRADSAIAHLRHDEDRDEAVHEARKDLKKLRSLLRLARGGLPRKAYRRENHRFRDVGRSLSASRDAAARLETVQALRERYGPELPDASALVARLEAQAAEHHGAGGGAIDDAVAELTSATQALQGLSLKDRDGFALLAPGLERSYRRGRAARRAVRRDPTPEAVHHWRKRVKDHWYHLRLLREAWPAALKGPEAEAHALADLLGDHHDLTVLRDELDREGEDEALDAFAEHRQEELLSEALPLGALLYAEKPGAYVKRVGSYWGAWVASWS
jgi:CHAD domain-containing protein